MWDLFPGFIGLEGSKKLKKLKRIARPPVYLQIKSMSLPPGAGAITSLTLLDPVTVLVGTDSGRIFQMDTLTFDIALLSTCHTSNISDIAFPRYV